MIQSFMEVSQTVHGKAQNLQYAVLTDSPFQDKLDRLADEINPGETIQGAYPYEFINENNQSLVHLGLPDSNFYLLFRWKRFSFYKTCVNVFALSKFSPH